MRGRVGVGQLVRDHSELISGLNLALLAAVAETCGGGYEAWLGPAPERCCLAINSR